jgi:hypothetical protein
VVVNEITLIRIVYNMNIKNKITNTKYYSIVIPVIIGIVLGLTAKLVDTPEMLGTFRIFDDIFGRFGIWIFVATMLAFFSRTPVYAAIRVFSFFVSMLFTYYLYTVLFLGFFPKSQIILWGAISLISPVCAVLMWYMNEDKWIANIISALPIVVLCTEWYLTAMKTIFLLFIAYLCMIICLLIYIPKNRWQCLSIILIAAIMSLILIKTGLMNYIYGLLNV